MKNATFKQYFLEFKQPSGTSRGVLTSKETYFLEITEGDKKGIGECGIFRGLSFEDVPEYEEMLQWLCDNINANKKLLRKELLHFPSIWFGYEQAMLNLQNGEDLYFPSDFSEGYSSLKINGLIWMGTAEFMQQQIEEKLEQGFGCIKLKIGVDWKSEKEILKKIRQKFSKEDLELRVDANGGFSFEEAKVVLKELADLDIHSIEQPIKAGNVSEMAELCKNTPIPIALDEELIGVLNFEDKKELLEKIKPQFIILKPSLVGGFSGTDEWISFAEEKGIGWWITSALESNVGLNAIAQYTFTKNPKIPQGLGTGRLFTNNLETRLVLHGDELMMR
ncbi:MULTISPECIES: o-succinylbenzoate synthase [unclassified Kaistella]|uniref:o-succinylbenzoate synthase n=1 Tax=unclassified Kaistella TaxID=2762626 RepID=UPI0027335AB1|nr:MULTISPECIES: o-succinylbenzoate synthase [unclassified Kaistella]MDP2453743.1 o-succinylbenzoate synthase [Kaistella sp. SH11-4b]MDP2456800.1 o-succinylbenzoate synthase [Kaistella sp. SH40-3]MDP2459556.1 o-succinylbenzoate synthase [Kaistella sp. SH19-2b]